MRISHTDAPRVQIKSDGRALRIRLEPLDPVEIINTRACLAPADFLADAVAELCSDSDPHTLHVLAETIRGTRNVSTSGAATLAEVRTAAIALDIETLQDLVDELARVCQKNGEDGHLQAAACVLKFDSGCRRNVAMNRAPKEPMPTTKQAAERLDFILKIQFYNRSYCKTIRELAAIVDGDAEAQFVMLEALDFTRGKRKRQRFNGPADMLIAGFVDLLAARAELASTEFLADSFAALADDRAQDATDSGSATDLVQLARHVANQAGMYPADRAALYRLARGIMALPPQPETTDDHPDFEFKPISDLPGCRLVAMGVDK